MIDEELLRESLRSAGDDISLPPDGMETILARRDRAEQESVGGGGEGRPAHHRLRGVAIAAVLIAVVGVGASVLRRSSTPRSLSKDALARPGDESSTRKGSATVTTIGPQVAAGSVGGAAGSNTSGATAGSVGDAGTPVAAPGVTQRVVKTGSVALEVKPGTVGDVTVRLTSLATGGGGFVASSRSDEAVGSPSASLTLRVPASGFEALVQQVRTLGKVVQVTSQGQDVTGQLVDLDARIQALTATRQQYLSLLSRASSIGDILNVQQHVSDLQTQIEQLQGQRKLLDDQASFATLDVHVAETSSTHPISELRKPASGMAKAWRQARHGFVSGVEWVVAASGPVAFVLVLLALGALVWRVARPRVQRARL
jgi:hypothetical protein